MSHVTPHFVVSRALPNWLSGRLAQCLVGASLLLGASRASAQDLSAQLDDYLRACVRVERFSGSVLIVKDGNPLLSKGYALADIEHLVRNTPKTKFRLGSLTKPLTATGIMVLKDRGKLDLSDAVGKYLADAPSLWKPITVHHLLNHTSGIPSFTSFPDYQQTETLPSTLDQTIARFKDKPLEFSPGSDFRASNSGYVLLGAIIEKVCGTSYEQALKDLLFQPAGMNDTGYDARQKIIPERAQGYTRTAEEIEHAPYMDMSIPHAAGGLYSTVEDLGRFDRALMSGKSLSAESQEKMFTPGQGDCGYGWTIRTDAARLEIGQGGGIRGFSAFMLRYPAQKVCVVVLSNVDYAPAARMAHDLASIVFGRPTTLPTARRPVPIDPKVYDDYVGDYQVTPESTLRVSRDQERLMVQMTGQPRVEAFPESESKFFLKVVDAQITFLRDGAGHVSHALLHQDGRDLRVAKASQAASSESPARR